MKKVVLLFVIAALFSFWFFFWVKSSDAWQIGKVRPDEKNKDNFIVSIMDYEISAIRPIIEVTITPNFKPVILNFFEVENKDDLTGKDRERIKKNPSDLIRYIDEAIKIIKEKYYKNTKTILVRR